MSSRLLCKSFDFATNLRTFSLFLENFLIVLIIIRILISLKNGKKFIHNSYEVVFYILIFSTSKIFAYLFPHNIYCFNFTHAFTPLMFIFTLTKINISKQSIIFIYLIFAIANLFFINIIFIYVTYTISILLLINKGVFLSKKASQHISNSPFYFFLSFDQILTFGLFTMSNLNFDWHNSHLIGYYNIIIKIVFPSTLIYTNVKFRRLILN